MHKKMAFIKNILASNFTRLQSPYKITFAVTYKCNLKCKICKIWQNPPQREVGIEEIERIFKSLSNLSWIDLTGGEITLREEIIEIIKVIIKNSDKILIFHISTNGQLPDKMFLIVKEILKLDVVPFINVSIDGPQLINDRLRGVNGAYEASLETFNKLKQFTKIHCYLSCTLSNFNINSVDDLLSALKKEIQNFDFSDMHFNIFHASAHYYNNHGIDGSVNSNPGMIKNYLSLCKKGHSVKVFLENEYLKGVDYFLQGNKFPVKCQALNATCFIDPFGRIYPCGMYSEVLGELSSCNFDFKKIWNSEKSSQIRRSIQAKKCPGCWSPCEAYPAILGCLINR
ncbi:MAG: radical SAM protein [Candidatus Omnitrophota bacterium]|nr:radical SAM protein [Candidatus Omnitrophota bacterium]